MTVSHNDPASLRPLHLVLHHSTLHAYVRWNRIKATCEQRYVCIDSLTLLSLPIQTPVLVILAVTSLSPRFACIWMTIYGFLDGIVDTSLGSVAIKTPAANDRSCMPTTLMAACTQVNVARSDVM